MFLTRILEYPVSNGNKHITVFYPKNRCFYNLKTHVFYENTLFPALKVPKKGVKKALKRAVFSAFLALKRAVFSAFFYEYPASNTCFFRGHKKALKNRCFYTLKTPVFYENTLFPALKVPKKGSKKR